MSQSENKVVNIVYKGKLEGHRGWVTCIYATTVNTKDDKTKEILVSGSRDKSLITWDLLKDQDCFGKPKRRLLGHAHFVSDVVVSSDGSFALSSSWDRSLRLWKLSDGSTTKRFTGHKSDVLSVAFSSDNRQIVSGSRDKTIKIWNTVGDCKYTLTNQGHSGWVTCVKFSPHNKKKPLLISSGYDKVVKVWDLSTFKLATNLIGHTGFISSVTVSPDGSLCASGGKDGTAMLWDLNKGEHLYSLNAKNPIHCLAFSPTRYWLCAATDECIKIWNLETKSLVAELQTEKSSKGKKPSCISLAWSGDGTTLYSGYTDNVIRVWGVYTSNTE